MSIIGPRDNGRIPLLYGQQKSYGALLEEAGLKTLKERRQEHFIKFAKKTSENVNYSELFPKNSRRQSVRNPKVFLEKFARTDRLYNSPVYAMRRALNCTPYHDRFNNPNTIDLSHLFNDPFSG